MHSKRVVNEDKIANIKNIIIFFVINLFIFGIKNYSTYLQT